MRPKTDALPPLSGASNRALVFEQILLKQPVSRAELARLTGLSKVACSSIVASFLEKGWLLEKGTGDSLGGRRPVLLEQNPFAALALGVDLAPDDIGLLATDLAGRPLLRERHLPMPKRKDDVLPLLQQAIEDLLASIPPHQPVQPLLRHEAGLPIAGLGIAVHGHVQEQEIIFAPYSPIAHVPIAKKLKAHFGFPIYLANEANLVALAELAVGQQADRLLALSIHSGIGAGLLYGGQIEMGSHGLAGEVGHMILYPGGRSCPCGNAGCVEQYISERALLSDWQAEATSNAAWSKLVEGFQRRDPATAAIRQQFINGMAVLVNNLQRNMDPDQIVINSQLVSSCPELLDEIRHSSAVKQDPQLQLSASALGEPARLLGAIALVLQQFYQIQKPLFDKSLRLDRMP